MTRAAPPASAVVENMGVRTFNFEDASRKRPVVVELWYPTLKSGPFDEPESSDVVWIHPKAVRNVPFADMRKKYPLIILSHGHGGDRRNLSWLAEQLVQNGYIVASVEHHGSSWRSYNSLLSLRFWERPRDISFALHQLLKEPSLKNQIDPNRIGFVGYSLGGMTGLLLAGAKAQNVKEVIIQQQSKLKEIDSAMVEQVDFKEAETSFAEPRIKSMVLLSPAAFIFPASSFKDVKIPIGLVASEGDEVLPYKEHALHVITHLVPTKLKMLHNKVSHYVFLNRVSEPGKVVVREEMRTDSIEADRPGVHREVGEFTIDFFHETLK